mmetsp:Transcript_46116/g.108224  ORF Transcript_46116/g.108224 Transcript_46116/m.108224 type:complete len:264 (+) Transcript_46116:84-875(+)|eukprot:886498-Rhodomonas_salina.1
MSDDKVQVYIFQRSGQNPDGSPYGIKMLTFLRAAKIEYEARPFAEHQMKNAPKGKCPYVKKSNLNGGKELADTAVIIDALVESGMAPDFDSWLSESDKAIAMAMRALLEDTIYWYCHWVRWCTDQFWSKTSPAFFGNLPWPLRPIVSYMVRRDADAQNRAQGTGRHSSDELLKFTEQKLTTVSTFLGDKKYMMGNQISTLDFSAFGILANHMQGPWEHPILDVARKDKRLTDYVDRMRAEFFPELICETEEHPSSNAEKSKAS